MGKKRMAQTLARAGLTLGVSTVGRILKEGAGRRPEPMESAVSKEPVVKQVKGSPVQAKAPNHVWQVDLTLVPTAAGFWTPGCRSPLCSGGPSRGGWRAWLTNTLDE